jgi:hypothetical protein
MMGRTNGMVNKLSHGTLPAGQMDEVRLLYLANFASRRT